MLKLLSKKVIKQININHVRIRLKTLIDTSSDIQILLLDEVIKDLIYRDRFQRNSYKENKNFTTNGLRLNLEEDQSEGNFGTLYRTPDND